MSDTIYTPGPWYLAGGPGKRGERYLGTPAICLAVVQPNATGEGGAASEEEEVEANAKLIAAAPDLLAALVRLLDEQCPFTCDTDDCDCGEHGNGRDDAGNVCAHIQAARAIARVRGK